MILTTCAACAAPLAHNAPRCVRCHTRYCNQTCQHDHYVGRPETDGARSLAMKLLANGLNAVKRYDEQITVIEANNY